MGELGGLQMSDSYEINEFNEVVPYICGRKDNDTRNWRDATDLELEQRERIAELENELTRVEHERDDAIDIIKTIKDISIECSSIGIDTINAIIKEQSK
jgi:hypothetical protein